VNRRLLCDIFQIGTCVRSPDQMRCLSPTDLGRVRKPKRARAEVRNQRYLVVAARSGEGPFTGPLRTHSSRIANRYFVEFTASARASRLTMGFAQLNPSYGKTTERIQDPARPARIASLISAASGRCRWEFAARTSPLDIIS
jgi:hypothetical protein